METNRRPYSLRLFILINICVSIICCIGVIVAIFFNNMLNMVKEIEFEYMDGIGKVIQASLEDAMDGFHSNTRAWACWDELYAHVKGKGNNYAEEDSLINSSMLSMYKVDYAVVKDTENNIVFADARNDHYGEAKLEFPDGLTDYISDLCNDVLRNYDSKIGVNGTPYSDMGFIVYEGKTYMICVMPILTSDETGPPAGTLTFITNYGEEELRILTHLDNSNFVLFPKDSEGASNAAENLGNIVRSKNAVSINFFIPNLGNDRFSIIKFSHSRNLYDHSLSLILTTLISSLLSVIVIMVVLYLFIRHSALRPLANLISDVGTIENDSEIDEKKYNRSQEFLTLSSAINGMIRRMDHCHRTAEESKISVNILKNILNGLDAYLYVSDIDTDEILFINDNMRKHFGLDDSLLGHKCWKVLQSGFGGRCDFCPCHKLSKDPLTPVIWEEHNTITGRYYRNTDCYIDWIGGRKAHLQHSVDITDIKMAQFALDKRLRQQALMTFISKSFVSDEDIDALISNALRMTGEFLEIAQILFYKFDNRQNVFVCQNEWIEPSLDLDSRVGGIFPILEGSQKILEMMTLKHRQGGCINSNSPEVKRIMDKYRVNFQKYITIPILVENKIYGIMDFSAKDDEVEWSEADTSLAVLLANLLSGVFSRSGMEDQLRVLSSIVESSPQFILYTTRDGTINYINPASSDITGYTVSELKEGGVDIIFDPETARDIREKYIPDTFIKGTNNFEIELICKDGRKKIMAFSSFTTGTDVSNLGGIAQDITEVRQLERDLIAAKELAEQGSRAKGEFLSRMSHEMRTPMNAIIGMTEIAKNSRDSAKKEYCLDRISNASRHLLGVINDILDMSKIEANKFELNFAEFNFERMLVNVFDVVNFRIEEKHQEFNIDVEPDIPSDLIGDEQHLAQVITNLLTNAVKFTPDHGKIQFKIFLVAEEDEILTLQIEVIDSGIGISKKQQSKLFRSFEQADGSIARRFGGTGLGLVISKRIVELMGGEIWVESEPGRGSKFAFTLKVKRAGESVRETFRKRLRANELNIMFVDDSDETCDFFNHVMNEMEIPCTVVTDGANALEIFRNSGKPFDIIFTDWLMPGMNGIELTRRLRSIPARNPIIIMVSVGEWSDIKDDALAAGVDDFLPKPLFPSLLMDCINKKLGMVSENSEGANAPQIDSRGDGLDANDTANMYEGRAALLAEDVDINREIILTVLEDTMLQIDCAENGREAVEMFSANPDRYDIVFMDVHMPEVDGLEATKKIRSLPVPHGKEVPIVAMTANVFKEDIEKCLEAGMNDHIGKPIDFDELFVKLKKYIK